MKKSEKNVVNRKDKRGVLMIYVWDTGALSLFFADHSKAKSLMKDITSGKALGFIPRIIMTEFFYKTCQKLGKQIAEIRITALRHTNIQEKPLEENDVVSTGMLKIKFPELSLADCIVVNLGEKSKATVITTEREITRVEGLKTIKLDF